MTFMLPLSLPSSPINHPFKSSIGDSSITSTSTSYLTAMMSPSSSATSVQRNEKEYEVVKEGLAYIFKPTSETPSNPHKENAKQNSVFYNPIQQFNRDLSVLAIRAYGEHVLALRNQRMARGAARFVSGTKRKRGELDNEGGDLARDQISPANKDGEITSTLAQSAKQQAQNFTILDALSATGLRAIRYAKEIPFATAIVANDLSASAIQSIN